MLKSINPLNLRCVCTQKISWQASYYNHAKAQITSSGSGIGSKKSRTLTSPVYSCTVHGVLSGLFGLQRSPQSAKLICGFRDRN
jgi:hypothetical protein